MARTSRYDVRVSPELAAQINVAAGIASRSRWIEQAIVEKLERDGKGQGLVQRVALPEPELSASPPLQRQDEFPRRPPPRLTGGRQQR